MLRQALLLLGLALLPAIVHGLYLRDRVSWHEPPAADEISIAQAQESERSVLWVDARPEVDYNTGHIPGALLLNPEQYDSLLPQVLSAWSPERKIVVYCSKQSCGASREVARRLREEAQLKNVFVLNGGWETWQASRH